MAELVEIALYRGIGAFFLLFVIFPAALLFGGYVVYIAVMTWKELKKK